MNIYTTTLFFLFLSGLNVYALEFPSQGRCITIHLQEAIEINQERSPLYSQISQEKSERISRRLIFMERQMLIGSFLLDRLASKYQKQGIPVFCQDMIPMEATPIFQKGFPQGPPDLNHYQRLNISEIRRDLKRGLKQSGPQGLDQAATKWFHELNKEPRFNCLTRHFLEAFIRSARLAQKYHQYAVEHNLKSPKRLMNLYLRLSLFGLGQGATLDHMAAPLQAQNIPILCQDVPHIPFESEWPAQNLSP